MFGEKGRRTVAQSLTLPESGHVGCRSLVSEHKADLDLDKSGLNLFWPLTSCGPVTCSTNSE